jgi:protein-S-isoprenylcysteine O-methyltransferase Ste14
MAGFRISLGTSRELEPGVPVSELVYPWVLVIAGTALGAFLTGSQSRSSVMLGAPFLLLGALLAVATVRTLGRAQYLVTEGPYRFVRHPYYLAILVMLVGAVIALRSWPGAVLLIPAVMVTVDRARREEHNLAIRFEERFEDYCRQVSFLLPLKPPLKTPLAEPEAGEPDETPAPTSSTGAGDRPHDGEPPTDVPSPT